MTSRLAPPSAARDHRDLERRVTELERRLAVKPTRRRSGDESVPSVCVALTSTVPIPHVTETTVTWATARWDTHGMWDGGSRLIVPPGWSGLWRVWGMTMWNIFEIPENPGFVTFHLKAGSTIIADPHIPTVNNFALPAFTAGRDARLSAGAQVTMTVLWQIQGGVTSGGASLFGGIGHNEMGMTWVRP